MIRRSSAWIGAPLAALLLLAAPASAQERHGLVFVGGIGYEVGGPGPSLVESLEGANLDGLKPGRCYLETCVDEVDYPFYFDEGLPLTAFLGARYRFRAPFSVELMVSNGQRGHAEGFSDETKETFVVAYASFMATATAGVHVGPVRLEAGPVLNQMQWDVQRDAQELADRGMSVFGATFGASGTIRFSSVMVSVRGGVRQFPTMDLRELRVPLEADYESFFVGVTVLPAG